MYDIIGRKKPIVFLMILNAAMQFWVPFISDIGTFYVAAGLMAPAMIV
jgi:hypothetical protein